MKTIQLYPRSKEWKPMMYYSDFLFPEKELVYIDDPLKSLDKRKENTKMLIIKENSISHKEIQQLENFGYNIEIYDNAYPNESNKKERYPNIITRQNSNEAKYIKEIKVPVIFVLGLYGNLDKFAVQIALRKILKKNKLIVSQIGTRNYCEKFGFHSFPQFMFEDELSAIDKVFEFNEYANQIVEREKSDVLIIGVPGAYGKLNNDHPLDFGIIPYLVSQAISPDFCVMCTFYSEKNNEDFLKLISESCKYKLGFAIDCFHMSGNYINFQDTKEFHEVKYSCVSDECVENTILNEHISNEISLFNIYCKNSEEVLENKIFEVLSASYKEVDAVWI